MAQKILHMNIKILNSPYKRWFLSLSLLYCVLLFTGEAAAREKGSSSVSGLTKSFQQLKRQYRTQQINDKQMWEKLSDLYEQFRKQDSGANPSELLQTQAYLLYKGGYPWLAAKYATRAIMAAPKPYSSSLKPAWQILDQVAQKEQIHQLLINLAKQLGPTKTQPPYWGRNWYYFQGQAALLRDQLKQALAFFKQLRIKDRYYFAARYELAMSYLFNQDTPNKAGIILRDLVSPELVYASPLPKSVIYEYRDYAFLGLGRIQYERKKYTSSAKYFRKVRRTSYLYYDAIFEQAWSFFLAGYPNHALGALHATSSPFFTGRFSPEIPVLRALIYYWMCRYDDARAAMAEFFEYYAKPVEQLENWLEANKDKPDKAYALFENLIAGVSAQSLGISRDLLEHAAKQPPMVLARDELATVLEERERFNARGIFNLKTHNGFAKRLLDHWIDDLEQRLGNTFLEQLVALRDQYRSFRSQANFIFIELEMSQKEHVLGSELHGDSKFKSARIQLAAKGWGKANLAWKPSDKGEYWWDEVGYYIYNEQPLCHDMNTANNKVAP